MSSPYDRYDRSSRRRGVWGHWVPLVLTVTIATVGLAAWAWSQRNDDDNEDSEPIQPDLDYENADYGDNPPYGATSSRTPPASQVGGAQPSGNEPAAPETPASWGARMSGALRRTPSPQQFLDSAGRTVAAGVAAAGAAVGSALASIREEDKTAYADHETWSEEADAKKDRPSSASPGAKDPSKHRKTVAIVVSADSQTEEDDADGFHEHASILSHIPRLNDFSKIKLFVLIYAPGVKDLPTNLGQDATPGSLNSSYSNIGHEQVQSPGNEKESPLLAASPANLAFNVVYSQARTLVEKETMIMPFSSPNGHVHILRHLQPDIVYLQESLAGENGNVVAHLQTWLRHDIILVVGAESGHGGLADSESEAERPGKEQEKWWHREDRVGRGRGVVVVDSMRVTDDWARRVQERE